MDRPLHILILEDNESDALLVLRELQKGGMHFEPARALTREEYTAEVNCRPPDLILADYALPSFDGLAALRIARKICPDIPFIFVTGALGEERAIETLKSGATDYVLKDRLARLVPAVQRALEEAEERRKRREAEEQVERSHQQLRTLSRRLVEVHEEERRSLSRELHDEAGQTLTALTLGLGLLRREPGCTEAMQAKIDDLRRIANEATETLHRLALDLRPTSLDRYGLVPALEGYIASFQKQTGLEVVFAGEALRAERVPASVETGFYRVVQEALTNAARYARASQIGVMLQRQQDGITLIVEDNGVGFDVGEALLRSRLGLLGMRERAEMLGGTLTIESHPGHGTTIYVAVPIAAPKTDGREDPGS